MNTEDRQRAKLFALGQEIEAAHWSKSCGRRGCSCLAKYEAIRKRYLKLVDSYGKPTNPRRRGRS